ncbi:MAG TPA: hypothetical protein PKD70_00380 [Saprospiraceae bacterium]|nr:hypothetical protein [Saprospiraceae bacterium]HMP12301.1 hypothetical protein [Saprospiraceae bacterium]
MKRFKNILLVVALLVVSLSLMAQTATTPRQLVKMDGVYIEKFESHYTEDNRYTEDNMTYTEGLTFTYSYRFFDQKGSEFIHRSLETAAIDHEKAWELVPVAQAGDAAVRAVQMTVLHGLQGFDLIKPDYNRTVIQYDYLTADGNTRYSEMTGIVENERNIWMHPPRSKLFRILELNPFPFIQTPYQVGHEWTWTQQIGSYWSDARWKEWKGAITNTYTYRITNKKMVRTTFGTLECYEVRAKAESELGETEMTGLFNPDYGFVQLDYVNIDGSRMVMELTGRISETSMMAQTSSR